MDLHSLMWEPHSPCTLGFSHGPRCACGLRRRQSAPVCVHVHAVACEKRGTAQSAPYWSWPVAPGWVGKKTAG